MTKNIDILLKLIPLKTIKVISIDIFDTLIIFPEIKPNDIFYFLDDYIKNFDYHNKTFSKIRTDCERFLSLETGEENVTIDSIYGNIGNQVNLNNNQINSLKERELSVFLNLACLNEEVLDILKKAKDFGKRIILISDTCYSSNFITLLLNKFNIFYDFLYASTDLKMIKSSEKLYDEIIRNENVLPSEILHIGDNDPNDNQIPLDKGILAFHYFPFYLSTKKNYFYTDKYYNQEITSIFLGFLINKESELTINENMKYTNIYDFCYYSIGPFVLSLVFYLLFSKKLQDFYSTFLFNFCDGYLPFKVYDRLSKVFGYGIPCKYISDNMDIKLENNNSILFNCIHKSSNIDSICLWAENQYNIINENEKIKTYLLFTNYDKIKPLNILFKEIFSNLEPLSIEVHKGVFDFIDNFCQHFKDYLYYFKNIDYKCVFDYTMQHLFIKNDKTLDLFKNTISYNTYRDEKHINTLSNILYLKNHNNPFKGNALISYNNLYINENLKYNNPNFKIGIHIHFFHASLYLDFIERLKDFPYSFDLYVTTPKKQYEYIIYTIFSPALIPNLKELKIIYTPNKGRDIAPWIIEIRDIQFKYDIFGHFHTKKSDHINYSTHWRNYLFDNLLNKKSVLDILKIFYEDENVGIVYPPLNKDVYSIHNSTGDPIFQEIDLIKTYLSKIELPVITNYSEILFSAGTMFWYRPSALKKLFFNNLSYNDFPNEPIGSNGTLAHAIERLPSYIASDSGYITKLYMNPKLLSKTLFDLYYTNTDIDKLFAEREELILENTRLISDINAIFNSKSWIITKPLRMLRAFNKDNILFQIFAKLFTFCFLHPFKFISKLTPKRIWHFFYTLKTEGTTGILKKIDNVSSNNKIPKYSQEIKLVELKRNINKITDFKQIIFDNITNPLVSIIIPVYNQFNYTYNCLESILNNSGKKIDYEIIIADDCSDDFTSNINEIIFNITVIKTPTNLRFLKNCNNAAKYAKGKYILFLNNDTQVQNNWLAPLVNLIENDDSIGAVGSKILLKNGLILEAVGVIWNDASAWNYGRLSDPSMPEYNYVKEVDYLSGASILIRKTIWDKLGGFDENFAPSYYEDPDLCFSIRKMGFKVVYQPLSVVVHFEGISNGTDTTKGIKQFQVINKKKFFEKWRLILEKEHFTKETHIFHARDRSRDKKTILIINDYVPHYDKDAGSKTIFQYIKLFLNLGFNIKFIDDSFFKYDPYTSVLEQLGIEVLYGTYYFKNWKNWLKNNAKYIDYVFLSRPHIATKYIDTIKKITNAKIIFYGHDLRFLREKREYEFNNDKNLLKSYNKWKYTEFELMKKANVTYYPSQVEVDEIKKINPSIVAKVIPAFIFQIKPIIERNFTDTMDIMFIGGFLHNPNIDGVLWYIKEIFPVLNKLRADIKTYIIGSNVPKDFYNINYDNIIITGHLTEEKLNYYYKKCRLSIAPLRYGAGVKGKVIEAMYNQIPVVTTSIGAEGINGAESCMFIKDDPISFAKEIIRVYDNIDLLSKISIKEIELINRDYTQDAALKIISSDFDI